MESGIRICICETCMSHSDIVPYNFPHKTSVHPIVDLTSTKLQNFTEEKRNQNQKQNYISSPSSGRDRIEIRANKTGNLKNQRREMENSMNYESCLNLKATELRLGLPGIDEPEKKSSSSVKINKRSLSEISDDASPPPAKSQVVGWPPVRNYRKNCLQKKEGEGIGAFVKVSMDGAPYLRKIDIRVYKSYSELLEALENMFNLTIGYRGSDFVPTYQDKDGDWMLVGDVPWEMFLCSCKRLRIMKGSEARGLSSSL